MIKPYLKWLGGKYRLVSKLHQYLPKHYVDYYEPFLGSAAMFLNIANSSDGDIFRESCGDYYLRDINDHLINCHKVVADKMDPLIKKMNYYSKKEKDNIDIYDSERKKTENEIANFGSNITSAARVIYLNRRAYGGMWRENKRGIFNVPKCESQTFSLITDEFFNKLKSCSRILQKADISCGEYKDIEPKKDDFVFLDPPYFPVSISSNFTSYTKDQWGMKQHDDLFDFLDLLDKNGVKFLMTNSDTPYVVRKTSKYNVHSHEVSRFIDALKYRNNTSKEQGRERAKELIIWNY